jgi:hypothetical protein
MASRYQKLSPGLIIRKGSGKRQGFYLAAAPAVRLETNERGLLLQHQQQLKQGVKQQGANFFVKQENLPGFLQLIHQLLKERIDDFSVGFRPFILRQLPQGDGVNIATTNKDLEKLSGQLKRLTTERKSEVATLKSQLALKDKEIATLTKDLTKARRQRQQIRIVEMEQSVPEFKKQLAEFQRLIDEGKALASVKGMKQESLYQDFLKDNFWMFGVQYISMESKQRSGRDTIPDLLLQRTDGFNDVVELENPTDPLFVVKANRSEQSGALKEALAQTMDYLDDYDIGYQEDFYETGLDTYKPKGIIVIGRSGEKSAERRRRQLNSYLHGIEIWTYDDLIHNAQQVINLLERGPSKAVIATPSSKLPVRVVPLSQVPKGDKQVSAKAKNNSPLKAIQATKGRRTLKRIVRKK